jgi:hypothetical protein
MAWVCLGLAVSRLCFPALFVFSSVSFSVFSVSASLPLGASLPWLLGPCPSALPPARCRPRRPLLLLFAAPVASGLWSVGGPHCGCGGAVSGLGGVVFSVRCAAVAGAVRLAWCWRCGVLWRVFLGAGRSWCWCWRRWCLGCSALASVVRGSRVAWWGLWGFGLGLCWVWCGPVGVSWSFIPLRRCLLVFSARVLCSKLFSQVLPRRLGGSSFLSCPGTVFREVPCTVVAPEVICAAGWGGVLAVRVAVARGWHCSWTSSPRWFPCSI